MVLPTFLSLFIYSGKCESRSRVVEGRGRFVFKIGHEGLRGLSGVSPPTVQANSGDDVGARRVGAFWVRGVGMCCTSPRACCLVGRALRPLDSGRFLG